MSTKQEQLGMNPSTASHRLVKDILWSLIEKTEQDNCHQCGEKMQRDNFSIEHKEPWLHSEKPAELYFDLDNISFSHLRCNVEARRPYRVPCGTAGSYGGGCRCASCTDAHKIVRRQYYTKEKRREKYLKHGY